MAAVAYNPAQHMPQVVGEGFHPKAGMPHAEVYALRAAGRGVGNLRTM